MKTRIHQFINQWKAKRTSYVFGSDAHVGCSLVACSSSFHMHVQFASVLPCACDNLLPYLHELASTAEVKAGVCANHAMLTFSSWWRIRAKLLKVDDDPTVNFLHQWLQCPVDHLLAVHRIRATWSENIRLPPACGLIKLHDRGSSCCYHVYVTR